MSVVLTPSEIAQPSGPSVVLLRVLENDAGAVMRAMQRV